MLGFDGADHEMVARMIAEGKLPNLARLGASGSFEKLRPTIPAQTPVSWSTFTTGISPGRTLIFDFLKRDPKSYRPEFAIAEEGKRPFLFGARNRAALPALAAALVLVLGLAAVRVLARGSRAGLGAVASENDDPAARGGVRSGRREDGDGEERAGGPARLWRFDVHAEF